MDKRKKRNTENHWKRERSSKKHKRTKWNIAGHSK